MRHSGVTAFFLLGSLAEGAQSVVLMWLTYALTGDAVLVGLVVVLGYLPATVAGIPFRRFADRGRADGLARRTNLLLAAVSAALAGVSGSSAAVTVAAILLAQAVLSLVKMVNKAAVGRLVRDSFDAAAGARVLQLSSSASLIGTIAGAGLGGLLAACHLIALSLLGAAAAYAASAVAMARGTRGYRPGPERARVAAPTARLRRDPRLLTVLLFSVPSSGGLQFLATLLVPLAQAIAPGNPAYYAVLDVASVCGGFLAGIALSATPLSARTVLGFGLLAAAALAAALGAADGAVLVAALAFLLTFAITAHIVCMQVLTNQVPEPHEVGQFAVLRNTVASLAKAGFAFAAGVIAGATSAQTAAVVLAVSLLAFALAWPALGLRSRVVLEAAG